MSEIEIAPLKSILERRRAKVHTGVLKLRQRSRDCADLAASSVTLEGRRILSTLAEKLEREADELETTVAVIGRVQRESSVAASPEPCET